MHYTHATLAKQFWDGKKDGKEYSLDDKGIKVALRRALKDFTPRTEKRNNYLADKLGADEMFEKLGETYITKFVSFFNTNDVAHKSQHKFDEWHHDMCKIFLDVFRKYYNSLAYGKAQKIVNMTFKGIYCLKGSDQKEDYFKFCHMPLDSLTLEWFKRNCRLNGKPIVKGKVPSWSKLNFESSKNEYSYMEIINSIREFFDNKNGWTPLTAEFLIWPKIQLELAAEGLFSELSKFDDRPTDSKNFKNKSTKEKIEMLKEMLSNFDDAYIYGDVSKSSIQ